jgi:hypothetical protein
MRGLAPVPACPLVEEAADNLVGLYTNCAWKTACGGNPLVLSTITTVALAFSPFHQCIPAAEPQQLPVIEYFFSLGDNICRQRQILEPDFRFYAEAHFTIVSDSGIHFPAAIQLVLQV